MPVHRLKAVTCHLKEDYVYNGNLVPSRRAKYFKNNELVFSEKKAFLKDEGTDHLIRKPKEDGTYRTFFGPTFLHNGEIYANNEHNIRLALRRLLGTCGKTARETHNMMRNQAAYIARNRKFLELLRENHTVYFADYEGAFEEALKHHADPHDKRELRIKAWADLTETGRCHSALWMVRGIYVTGKLKKNEYAKPGKKPRLIIDFGPAASLQGFRTAHFYKKAQAQAKCIIEGTELQFIAKPTPSLLQSAMHKLISPPHRGYFCYFSDDACFSTRTSDGKIWRANVDISGCDRSHQESLFAGLLQATPTRALDDMKNLVKQNQMDLRIRDPTDRKKYIQFKLLRPVLMSGSTITTVVNNFANTLIGHSLATKTFTGSTHEEFSQFIKDAAFDVGYKVTVDQVRKIEDIQFLKHSPCKDTREIYRPVLNAGVLYRSSGQCKGDLPGRGDIEQRARVFQSNFLRGCYPHTHFPIIDAMKAATTFEKTIRNARTDRIVKKTISCAMRYRVAADDAPETWHFTDAALFKRYDLESFELAILQQDAKNSRFKMRFGNSALHKIFQKDYGLSCPGY